MAGEKNEAEVNQENADVRAALALTQRISTLDPAKQDEVLILFSRCLMHIRNPELGLEEIRTRARGG